MKIFSFLFFAMLVLVTTATSQVNSNNHYVNGYHRRDGTYVKGHYRTNRNHTNRDNYSTKPNVNPYTGKKGYIEPDNNYLPSYNYFTTPSYNYTPTPSYDYPPTYNSSTYKSNISTNSNYNPVSDLELSKIDLPTYSYGSSASRAISYHDRYSFSDKKMIEEFLKANDFHPGSADGIFTSQTIEAIKKMQRFIGVTADGRFGPNTLKRVTELLE